MRLFLLDLMSTELDRDLKIVHHQKVLQLHGVHG